MYLCGTVTSMPNGITVRSRRSGPVAYQAWVWIPDKGGLTQEKKSRTFSTEQAAIAWREAELVPVRLMLQRAQEDRERRKQDRSEILLRKQQEKDAIPLVQEAERRLQHPPEALEETWKPVPGWEDQYEVSTFGRVWSRPRFNVPGGLLTPLPTEKGYFRVTLGNRRSKHQIRKVHEIVLTTFVGPRPPRLMCRHLNGNPEDNRLVNLCWGTAKENAQDMILHGRTRASNTCCARGHEYTQKTTYITKSGTRNCRVCKAEDSRARTRRRKRS